MGSIKSKSTRRKKEEPQVTEILTQRNESVIDRPEKLDIENK